MEMSQNSKKLESLKYKTCFVYRLEIIKRLKKYNVLVFNPLPKLVNFNLANSRLV